MIFLIIIKSNYGGGDSSMLHIVVQTLSPGAVEKT